MKVIPINMTLSEQLKSRAMWAAFALIGFGAFMVVTGLFKAETMNLDVVKEGGTYVAAGIAIIGIRDKK